MLYAKKGFDPFSFVIGIIFVAMSIFVLSDPLKFLMSLIFIVAFSLVFEGIFKVANFWGFNRSIDLGRRWFVGSGIFDIILGVALFMVPKLGITYIWITFAIWFIIDSIFEICFSVNVNGISKPFFWFNLIFGIVGILVGVLLLVNPGIAISSALLLLGFYLVFFGIILIVRSF